MESVWTTKWFLRLMEHIGKLQENDDANGSSNEPQVSTGRVVVKEAELRRACILLLDLLFLYLQIIIADRSPLSAVFYSKTDGHLLEPLIRQYVKELREAADVHIITAHLHTERELLWSRILKRLELEPSRKQYAEDKREWMEKVCSFYESMAWDVTIHNNMNPISSLAAQLLNAAGRKHPDVRAAVHACAARTGIDLTDAETSTPAAAANSLSLDVDIKTSSSSSAATASSSATSSLDLKFASSLRLGRSPSADLLDNDVPGDDEDDTSSDNSAVSAGAGSSAGENSDPLPSASTPFKPRSTMAAMAQTITAPSPASVPREISITNAE
jgi:hypothetical protein